MLLEDLTKNDIEKIKRECSEFIKHNDKPLWRGRYKQDEIAKLIIRTDRRPRDSGNFNTDIYNAVIEEKLGIKNLRNRVAYATTNEEQAAYYGSPYMVFPINGTQFVYSSKTKDSVYETCDLGDIFKTVFEVYVGKYGLQDTDILEYFIDVEVRISPYLTKKQLIDFLVSWYKGYFKSKKQTTEFITSIIEDVIYQAWQRQRIGKDLIIHGTNKSIKKANKEFEVGMFGVKNYYVIRGDGLWTSDLDNTDKKSWLDIFKSKDKKQTTPKDWYQKVLKQ